MPVNKAEILNGRTGLVLHCISDTEAMLRDKTYNDIIFSSNVVSSEIMALKNGFKKAFQNERTVYYDLKVDHTGKPKCTKVWIGKKDLAELKKCVSSLPLSKLNAPFLKSNQEHATETKKPVLFSDFMKSNPVLLPEWHASAEPKQTTETMKSVPLLESNSSFLKEHEVLHKTKLPVEAVKQVPLSGYNFPLLQETIKQVPLSEFDFPIILKETELYKAKVIKIRPPNIFIAELISSKIPVFVFNRNFRPTKDSPKLKTDEPVICYIKKGDTVYVQVHRNKKPKEFEWSAVDCWREDDVPYPNRISEGFISSVSDSCWKKKAEKIKEPSHFITGRIIFVGHKTAQVESIKLKESVFFHRNMSFFFGVPLKNMNLARIFRKGDEVNFQLFDNIPGEASCVWIGSYINDYKDLFEVQLRMTSLIKYCEEKGIDQEIMRQILLEFGRQRDAEKSISNKDKETESQQFMRDSANTNSASNSSEINSVNLNGLISSSEMIAKAEDVSHGSLTTFDKNVESSLVNQNKSSSAIANGREIVATTPSGIELDNNQNKFKNSLEILNSSRDKSKNKSPLLVSVEDDNIVSNNETKRDACSSSETIVAFSETEGYKIKSPLLVSVEDDNVVSYIETKKDTNSSCETVVPFSETDRNVSTSNTDCENVDELVDSESRDDDSTNSSFFTVTSNYSHPNLYDYLNDESNASDSLISKPDMFLGKSKERTENEEIFQVNLLNKMATHSLRDSLLSVLKENFGEEASSALVPQAMNYIKMELNKYFVQDLMTKAVTFAVERRPVREKQFKSQFKIPRIGKTKMKLIVKEWKKRTAKIREEENFKRKRNKLDSLTARAKRYQQKLASVLPSPVAVTDTDSDVIDSNSDDVYYSDSENEESARLHKIVEDYMEFQNSDGSKFNSTFQERNFSEQGTQTTSTGAILYLQYVTD